jgi:YD repeat-containing protein
MWNYSYSSTATEWTTVVTDPQSRQSTYVFDATTRSIKRYTNTAGELTTYQNDAKGRPSIITLPTGETLRYQYDARGNVTETRRTSSPAGSPDLVSTAGYDATCSASTAKKCNKPIWTRDAAGNQTDYVYSTTHGNPTKITLPAASNGIRPVTDYTFTAFQAYYKNSGGTIVGAGTNVYYPTRVAQCRTTSGCSATSADQLRTDIGYGANNVANNRLPVQTTTRNGSGTLIATTSLRYDAVGNLVSVDGPLAGTVDKTVTRYDALRRVIGTVGPDPDNGGPRLHIGVRTAYDSRGLPVLVETGNLPGQSESSWASFVPAQSVVTEFDAERRATKRSLAAAGSTHAVEQVSFDTLGRVDCRVTRMNPAYFGALPASACTATSDGPFGPDRILKYGYDSADRVTSVISGFGQPDAIAQQAMTYFTGGRLSTLVDGKGNKTTYEYDAYGRLYRTYFPHPTSVGTSSSTDYEEYGYNVNSQVTSARRRSGVVIGTPRDALGRVTLQDVPATAEDVYFAYDNQGRLLSALFNNTAGNGVTQTYDGLGRMDTRTVFGRQLSYQYDLRGRRARLTHPDGFYVTYGYSNADELLTLTDSTGTTVATYGYDGLGTRTSLTRPNGASTVYVPDAAGRLQELRQDLSGTGFDLTETFAYNPAGQISSKTVSNDAAYTFVPSPLNSTTTAQFDGQNQLTNFAGSAITDDANGNVWTGLGSLAYTYDALGQLRQTSGGALVDYDPTGMLRRVQVGGTVKVDCGQFVGGHELMA